MSEKTVSEFLFEQFCNENSIPYSRIETQDYKTPDYDVYFGGQLVAIEIKQIDSNEDDIKHLKQLRLRGRVGIREIPGRRVRIKIDSAKKQLELRTQGKYPAVLVLYNNVPIGYIDSNDIKTAMYGSESGSILIPDDPEDTSIYIESISLGSGRKFTPNHNTTISAIALLYKFGEIIRLSIFHNIHAKCPFDPSWLRRNTVTHFTLEPQTQEKLQEWLEI